LSVTPTAQRRMITFLQDVIDDLENQQAEELETNTRPEENYGGKTAGRHGAWLPHTLLIDFQF
jgi:hypothetical protein